MRISATPRLGRKHSLRLADYVTRRYESDGSILAHTDGPAYDDRTCTLSCGADAVVVFRRRLRPADVGVVDAAPVAKVLLRRRSLLIFSGAAYAAHTHEIGAGAAVVGPQCANLDLAAALAGDVVSRDGVRYSFTLRRALAAGE